jgi:fatty acid desaturase
MRDQRPTDYFTETEIKLLRTRSNFRGAVAVAHCWSVILAAWIIASIWTNVFTVVLAILVIGTRQLGLFVLAHEGAHFNLSANRKLNDWLIQWPLNRVLLGGTGEGYRKVHVRHHANTQQENDPDLVLSKPFPISRYSFGRKVFRDLTGQTGFKLYGTTIKEAFSGETNLKSLYNGFRRLGPNLLINICFFSGFALAGAWYLYFLLWWVPALTWNHFVTRIRSIGEHAVVSDNDDRLKNTRTIIANWWERIFIAPYSVNYHLEHHLLVNCPYYNLKRAHQILIDKGIGDQMEIVHGYRNMFRRAILA